ncbi:HK97 family phage prohead protease [Edaphobacter aggregans]|uniref:HK97 family phage prohead protease n=1 Tax=Edaphobacter aggregans TaxID=570835 RepID=A0A428MFA6_9BACT|nr:HK97 family phage prohead protease [Edaphobacter aggregans]RSL15567.1 HK97 family phage prohead protease [Edaphobacter aggregans]
MNNKELRHLPVEELRISKPAADGKRTLSGRAIVFNQRSQDLGNFREVISPDAVTDTLNSGKNVLLLHNHDSGQILGSTRAGNLRLTTDSKGVSFTCPIDTRQSYANDLAISIERGDTAGCSFGFYCTRDSWKDDKGTAIRTVEALELTELTVTANPAYLQTQVDVRSCPKELRSLLAKRSNEDGCDCDCLMCVAGDCSQCLDSDCEDPACRVNGCPAQNEDRSILNKADEELWKLRMQVQILKLK